jgi:hypothetical protein
LEKEVRIAYEIIKVWNWGHTYMEMGDAEIPSCHFRRVELFLYHTLLEVVAHIGSLTPRLLEQYSVTNSMLCKAIQVVCTMAKGAAMALPTGSARPSGALLLSKACESVEHSILGERKSAMHRGHVTLAMVIAKDALYNQDRDALGSDNMFAYLFKSGTPMNFLRRVCDFAQTCEDSECVSTAINEVEVEMANAVRELEEEARRRRRHSKKTAGVRKTLSRQRSACMERSSDGHDVTPCELFRDSSADEEGRMARTYATKRKAVACSGAPARKYSRNEWMSKYPGVTRARYWVRTVHSNRTNRTFLTISALCPCGGV